MYSHMLSVIMVVKVIPVISLKLFMLFLNEAFPNSVYGFYGQN